MRRNAESLLVLVGASSPRQWSDPLPVADVIRAAVAEVEEYRRVTLRRVDEVLIAGAVVSGVAHLLAELVENGLTFSPPDLDVEIQGRMLGGHYLVAVIDQGIGMTAEELDEANRRLRGDGDFLVAPARFLGHYVVGRLARDLGVSVQLTQSPVTGTTARILLPAEMIERPAPVTGPIHTEPFEAESFEKGPVHDGELVETGIPTADGRLRPAVVEYVTAPVLPQQRSAAGSRTANGLPRRGRRTTPQPSAPPRRPADRPVAGEAGADEVRTRLTALRDGVRRGGA